MHERDDERRQVIELRRELHRHAERSNHERATPGIVRSFVERSGPDEVLSGLAGTGLAVVFAGAAAGPTVLVRAELDALPIPAGDRTPYASVDAEVSHRCGHDGHMAMVAALAPRLARRRPARGRVVLLFQPAEETGEGAARVVADPAFARIEPDWALALHNLPGRPLGEVILRDGPFAAASVGLVAELEGATSHAAHPEQGRSPAVAMADLVRELSGLTATVDTDGGFAVSTVIHARLGEVAFGTTPGRAVVMATLRAERDDVLERLRQAATDAAERHAGAHGLGLATDWREAFPATVNHPDAVALVERAAVAAGAPVHAAAEPFRWSEDFGHFTRRCRGVLFGLGSGEEQPPLHAPDYDFPEALLPVGTQVFARVLDELVGGAA